HGARGQVRMPSPAASDEARKQRRETGGRWNGMAIVLSGSYYRFHTSRSPGSGRICRDPPRRTPGRRPARRTKPRAGRGGGKPSRRGRGFDPPKPGTTTSGCWPAAEAPRAPRPDQDRRGATDRRRPTAAARPVFRPRPHWRSTMRLWLRSLRNVFHGRPRSRRPARRPALEGLEDRRLMAAGYLQTNLVSDLPGMAARTDPNLVNPWGIAPNPNGAIWVANNGSGTSTLYNNSG